MYEGHPINSGNFFIIRILLRFAYQNYIVSMAKHVAHRIHYPIFISGNNFPLLSNLRRLVKSPWPGS